MSVSEVAFKALKIEGWRQFARIDIELHPRLTVLTGANGAGKSSLLRLFSRHFSFARPFLATPSLSPSGGYEYVTGIFEKWKSILFNKRPSSNQVGTIKYSNGHTCALQVPISTQVEYNLGTDNQPAVDGIFIDSHQPILTYQWVGQIPATLVSAKTAYDNYNAELTHKYQNGHTGFSPIYRMKEAIISMAMFGEGNRHVSGNPDILHAYVGFVDALRHILPESLGFLDISVRPPEVVLVTKSGEFVIDAASGGVMTLIDLTWRLHMFSVGRSSFVVTMDEPENHLHPTMQRSLMRRLLSAFPQAQFIIATHSPFMVSSVKDSNVYVLRYVHEDSHAEMPIAATASRRVINEKLDTVNKAGNASEILRDVLGVSATIPEWVEEGLTSVVDRFRHVPITRDSLLKLREELVEMGYDELYPDALAALTRNT